MRPRITLVLRLVRKGFTPIVTQTVVQELGYTAQRGDTPRKRRSATTALMQMRQWGINPVALKPVGNGICDVIANVIASRGLLPAEERNDAFIFIECGFWQAALLITWDRHLLEVSNSALNEVLKSFDLAPVQVVSPNVILKD